MNKQQTLQNIWAMTDKTVIDMMTKKTCTSPSTLSPNDSADDNSDLESIDSRYGPFAAVPKEFRPPLPIRTKTEHTPMSLNENKQLLANKNPVSDSKHSAAKAALKVSPNPKPPLFRNSRPSFLANPKPPLLPTPKPPLLLNQKTPLLPNPKTVYMEGKRIPHRNETSVFKKDVNDLKHPQDVKNYHWVANGTTTPQKNTDAKKNRGVNGKTVFQSSKKICEKSLQKRDEALGMKGPKHESDKKVIKYELVNKQEHRTLKLNFEMPPKSNLQEQGPNKEELLLKKENKNFRGCIGREFNKDAQAVLCQENTVKWISSFNSDEENSDTDGKTERVFGKVTRRVLYQENPVKWDSSLYPEYLNTKDKTERDFGKDEQGIKWHSSLNVKDSSSDGEGRIEWTVIQEKKTIISAKKVEGKDHTYKQTNIKCLPTKPSTQNDSGKNKRHQRKKYFNKNMKDAKNYHRKNTPKPSQKGDGNIIYKNDLQLNNNLKHDPDEIQHSNTRAECNLDAETFTRQCRVSGLNFDSSNVSSSLLNDKPDFKVYSNAEHHCESNSHLGKTDNITSKRIEEQKESMLNYGREISNSIIGSYTALSMFISIFNEWRQSRLELIYHFQHIEKNIKESSKKYTKFRDVLDMAKTGASVAAAIPLPHVSVAARVISVLTGLFSVFLSNTEKSKGEVEDSNDMSIAATRDTNACSELYMFGLQCGQNFEETAKSIEEFHSNVADLEKEIFEKDNPEIAIFIRGVLEYKPRHRIFYKKLHSCFQELLQNCSSEFGKRFCEPFLLNSPGTIDVVEFLNWRFRHEDFNGESVRFELEQIDILIQGKDTSVKELTVRIQNCIGLLQDELKFLEGCVKGFNLFDKSVQFQNKY